MAEVLEDEGLVLEATQQEVVNSDRQVKRSRNRDSKGKRQRLTTMMLTQRKMPYPMKLSQQLTISAPQTRGLCASLTPVLMMLQTAQQTCINNQCSNMSRSHRPNTHKRILKLLKELSQALRRRIIRSVKQTLMYMGCWKATSGIAMTMGHKERVLEP